MALPISRINARFEGEFKFRGKWHSVPYVLPGELIQFTTHRGDGRGFRIQVDHVEQPETPVEHGLDLAEPFCNHYKKCGGCRGQHFTYETQLQIKMTPITTVLQEKYGIQTVILPAPETRHYRNRMDFVVEGDVVGQRAAGNFESFQDIDSCPIQKEEANGALSLFRQMIQKHPDVPFRRKDGTGVVRYFTIRRGKDSGVLVLTVLASRKNEPAYLQFLEDLKASIQMGTERGELAPGFSLLETEVDHEASELSCTPGGVTLLGEDGFFEELAHTQFRVPYDSFFQPNPKAFQGLIDFASQILTEQNLIPDNSGTLSDLYCGAGVLSAILHRGLGHPFQTVEGLDFTESAIGRAPEHFPHFDGKIDFVATDLNKPTVEVFRNGIPDLVIADPPRAGLSPAVRKAIAGSGTPVIAYFSCNPNSQLNDIRELEEFYRPVAAALSDPYPQTPHLEQVVILVRNETNQGN